MADTPFIDLMNEDKTDNLDAPLLAKPDNNTAENSGISALPPPQASPTQNAGPAQGASINSLPGGPTQQGGLELSPPPATPPGTGVQAQADALRNGMNAAPPSGYLADLRGAVHSALGEAASPSTDNDLADLRKALRMVVAEQPKKPTVAQQMGLREERTRDMGFGGSGRSFVVKAGDAIYDLGGDLDVNDNDAVRTRLDQFAQARQDMDDYYGGF